MTSMPDRRSGRFVVELTPGASDVYPDWNRHNLDNVGLRMAGQLAEELEL
jgi:hypothetical protein